MRSQRFNLLKVQPVTNTDALNFNIIINQSSSLLFLKGIVPNQILARVKTSQLEEAVLTVS